MAAGVRQGREVVLETDRLVLRPWRVAEAVVQRELWTERDPRVPPHRRISADGPPTVAELEDAIRAVRPSAAGLLAVERKVEGDVVGYCGLLDGERGLVGEAELAFELLRRVWGRGYATEASIAVLDWAGSSGYARVWATVWEWNTASRRVLEKLGFTETGRTEVDAVHGTTLFTTKQLTGGQSPAQPPSRQPDPPRCRGSVRQPVAGPAEAVVEPVAMAPLLYEAMPFRS